MLMTVICWLLLLVLPQTSVAVHVRVRRYVPEHEPAILVSVKVICGFASQLSIALGVADVGTASH